MDVPAVESCGMIALPRVNAVVASGAWLAAAVLPFPLTALTVVSAREPGWSPWVSGRRTSDAATPLTTDTLLIQTSCHVIAE